jgi:LmbE family N-acetylglucosaminyl deacetylase
MSERLLCIIAHPDDETIFAGGILAMLADRGFEIHILSATRGEGGELGSPPLTTRENLGQLREQELRCAARALGAVEVYLLDYIDPTAGPDDTLFPYTEDVDQLAADFLAEMERIAPDWVLTHGSGGEYGHPAHIVTHHAVLRAHELGRERGLSPRMYTFSAVIAGREDRIHNLDDPADLVVDVSPWLDRKAAAAECHRTQHALFVRRHPEAEAVLDVMRRLESLRRVWPLQGSEQPVLAPFRVNADEPT